MFRFNFSSEPSASVQETEIKNKETAIEWQDAKQLKISSDDTFHNDNWREIIFNNEILKILRREIALENIKNDNGPCKFTVEADLNNSDLQPAKYEGGLKVWECSEDLGAYMVNELGENKIKDKHVLDLGCGSGVIGILALKLGAKSVTFQDYNEEVLTHWTYPNVVNNLCDTNVCKFWSGDWLSFSKCCDDTFDVIFTSETIYNPDNYSKLIEIFQKQMNPGATVYLGAKTVYFSLGGSVPLFLDSLTKSNQFTSNQVFKSDDGVQRVIVEIKRNNERS